MTPSVLRVEIDLSGSRQMDIVYFWRLSPRWTRWAILSWQSSVQGCCERERETKKSIFVKGLISIFWSLLTNTNLRSTNCTFEYRHALLDDVKQAIPLAEALVYFIRLEDTHSLQKLRSGRADCLCLYEREILSLRVVNKSSAPFALTLTRTDHSFLRSPRTKPAPSMINAQTLLPILRRSRWVCRS